MTKTAKITLISLGAVLVLIIAVRAFSSEDSWNCENGQWVVHGHPTKPQPTTGCVDKTSQELLDEVNNQSNNKKSMNNQNPVAVTTNRTLPNQSDLFAQYSGAVLTTNLGDITIKFYPESPITVNNFLNLAKDNFYNNTKFHRVIKDFMIQGGDPNSQQTDSSTWGQGGPGYKFADEFNTHLLVKGSLAMANAGPDTNGSQFFIVTAAATPWLDGHHVNFGYVTKGIEVVDKIENSPTNASDQPSTPVVIKSVELLAK